jgi:class 3 adenylate cyclase
MTGEPIERPSDGMSPEPFVMAPGSVVPVLRAGHPDKTSGATPMRIAGVRCVHLGPTLPGCPELPAVAGHRRTAGFAPQVRIGIHAEEVLGSADGYRGRGVHVAARVGTEAGAGEILVSAGTLDGAGIEEETGAPWTARLKGLPRPWRWCPSCGAEPVWRTRP